MKTHKDQIGRTVVLNNTPTRIVSLVPSQSELLVALGLEASIVGVTKFCEHPAHLRKGNVVVGGTKHVHLDKIIALNPDIILCNKEENTAQMVRELETVAPVWVSNVISFQDNHRLIRAFGELFNVQNRANSLLKAIHKSQEAFKTWVDNERNIKVAYLIWNDPIMVAGGNTFINSLLELNGWTNTFARNTSRYPEVTVNDLKDLDLILLSSEPFPFKQKHIEAIKNYTQAEIHLVDGTYFSWYGSRMQFAFEYFKSLPFRPQP